MTKQKKYVVSCLAAVCILGLTGCGRDGGMGTTENTERMSNSTENMRDNAEDNTGNMTETDSNRYNTDQDRTDETGALNDLGDGVIDGVEDIGEGIKNGAEDIGDGIRDSVDQLGDDIENHTETDMENNKTSHVTQNGKVEMVQ